MVTKTQAQTEKTFHYGLCTKKQRPEVWKAHGPFTSYKRSGFMLKLKRKTGDTDHYATLAVLPKTFNSAQHYHSASKCRVHKGAK